MRIVHGNKRLELIAEISRLERRVFPKAQSWQGESGQEDFVSTGFGATVAAIQSFLSLEPAKDIRLRNNSDDTALYCWQMHKLPALARNLPSLQGV